MKAISFVQNLWSKWFWVLWSFDQVDSDHCDCFEIVFVILFLQNLWLKWFSILWSSNGQFWSFWLLWDFYQPPWITLGTPKTWWVGYENIIRIKISQCYFWKLPWHQSIQSREREILKKDIKGRWLSITQWLSKRKHFSSLKWIALLWFEF